MVNLQITAHYHKLSGLPQSGYTFWVRFKFSRQNSSVGRVSAKSGYFLIIFFFVKLQCSLLDFCHMTNFLSRWRVRSIRPMKTSLFHTIYRLLFSMRSKHQIELHIIKMLNFVFFSKKFPFSISPFEKTAVFWRKN